MSSSTTCDHRSQSRWAGGPGLGGTGGAGGGAGGAGAGDECDSSGVELWRKEMVLWIGPAERMSASRFKSVTSRPR